MGQPSPHLFSHVIWKLIEQQAHGAAIFHLNGNLAFYSVFIEESHLPRLVTWWKVIQPVFSGESRRFMGSQPFNSLPVSYTHLTLPTKA